PLRSAFGAFVGETTFIGNSNLIVEGQADQILLAGAATHLRRHNASVLEMLDLNRVTIVPAGSASHVPYLVYLARGRDVEQPAVIVLLDSDISGNQARKRLKKGGANGKPLLRDSLVLQIGDLSSNNALSLIQPGLLMETEDLVPLQLCAEAARKYAREVCGVTEVEINQKITTETIQAKLAAAKTVFDAIEECFADLSDADFHIEKVGFARNIVDQLTQPDGLVAKDNIDAFENNMKILFRRLNEIRRDAERELASERVTNKINRLKNSFFQDHPTTARREDVHVLFENMLASLDDGPESDAVVVAISQLRREFEVDDDQTQSVKEYDNFKERLDLIRYAGLLASQENRDQYTFDSKGEKSGPTSIVAEIPAPQAITDAKSIDQG
ncbi:MAG TPA: hypothetical protein VFM05_11550, partial [Candidatus Saccharimonadales bacterium]|nr:hypothetical protein [Candidatus Saccharimonadales bacterium]